MRLFGTTREPTATEAAEATLTKARERHGRLAVQLADAARELDQRKAATADAALNENAVDVADRAGDVATAAATHEALEHAVGVVAAEVAKAERELAEARDAELRAASVAELRGLIDQIEAAALPFSAALADLLKPLGRGGEVNPDCKNIFGLFELLRSDVDQMLTNATGALGITAKSIELGSAPARLPKPAAAPIAATATAPAPTTTSVFPLYDISWTDHVGMVRTAAQYWDVGLPVVVAQRALTSGVVVTTDSPQAAKFRQERGSPNVGDVDRAVDLDAANPTPPAPPPERWGRPFADPTWQMPTDVGPRSWFGKAT